MYTNIKLILSSKKLSLLEAYLKDFKNNFNYIIILKLTWDYIRPSLKKMVRKRNIEEMAPRNAPVVKG